MEKIEKSREYSKLFYDISLILQPLLESFSDSISITKVQNLISDLAPMTSKAPNLKLSSFPRIVLVPFKGSKRFATSSRALCD